MVFEGIKFDNIDESHIQSLEENNVMESKILDYKQELHIEKTSEKKEFLYDVSSFANGAGGYLVIGISDTSGKPEKIVGVVIDNPDLYCQKLNNLIRDGIEPRIPGLQIRTIPWETKYILVIRIPQSWIKPHVVKLGGSFHFYSRTSSGKYKLDLPELKSLILNSELLEEKIRDFRVERISSIQVGETPIEMEGFGRSVLHIIPIESFQGNIQLDMNSRGTISQVFAPLEAQLIYKRLNLDGIVRYNPSVGYVQLYRNGIVEAVSTSNFYMNTDHEPCFNIGRFEKKVVRETGIFLEKMEKLGISPPLIVMISLVGMQDCIIPYSRMEQLRGDVHSYDRDMLLLPDFMIEHYTLDLEELLKPTLGLLFNAFGKMRE